MPWLETLGEDTVEALMSSLSAELDESERRRIAEAAEGNPRFTEQMVALALEEGGPAASLPPTIQALLAARLDRLEPDERALLECASVVGKEFSRGALLKLSPPGTEVSALLQRLVRRRLACPEHSSLPGEDAFRFAHVLVREAGYRAIPKGRRAEPHERLAGWLEQSASPCGEIVGYHLEQAYRHRAELGPLDDQGRTLARRAAQVLATAGSRAHARTDRAAAANLLSRASALLPDDDPLRLSLVSELEDDLFWGGRFSETQTFLRGSLEAARRTGDRRAEWYARMGQLRLEAQVGSKTALRELERRAEEARTVFRELGDQRGQARAGWLIGWLRDAQSRNKAAEQALAPALEAARLVGDTALESGCLGLLARTLLDGPTPIAEALDRIAELISTAPTRMLERVLLRQRALLLAEQGRCEEARDSLERSRVLMDDGSKFGPAGYTIFAADVDRYCGGPTAAEAKLRWALATLELLDEKALRSTVLAKLAEALATQARIEEAEPLLDLAGRLAMSDHLWTQVPINLVRAET